MEATLKAGAESATMLKRQEQIRRVRGRHIGVRVLHPVGEGIIVRRRERNGYGAGEDAGGAVKRQPKIGLTPKPVKQEVAQRAVAAGGRRQGQADGFARDVGLGGDGGNAEGRGGVFLNG